MTIRKRLKLYGEKDDFKGFIADIYVKDNKVVVEGKEENVTKELLSDINQVLEEVGYFQRVFSDHSEGCIKECVSMDRIGNPEFLEALRANFYGMVGFGIKSEFGGKKYGGYEIRAHKSEIVEE